MRILNFTINQLCDKDADLTNSTSLVSNLKSHISNLNKKGRAK